MAIPTDERVKDLLPNGVFRSVSRHLIRSGHKAEEGFPSGEEDEDTLTGDMLRPLRRPWSIPVEIDGSKWHWRVNTRKFRGKGELATESLIGADGIVQIEIIVPNGRIARKGILFQAKKGWIHRDQTLIRQVRMMEEAAPGGSVVFDYEADGYRAAPGTTFLELEGRPAQGHLRRPGEFLADEFLECTVGRRDTYYDWEARSLILAGARPGFYQMYPHFLAAIQVEGTFDSWSGKFL